MLRYFILNSLIISVILVSSCGEEGPDTIVSVEDQRAFLTNVGDNIIVPAYTDLNLKAEIMATTGDAFLENPTNEKLLAMRIALKDARLAWQSVNFYDFGPAASTGIASVINTFPADRESIEENISDGEYNLESISSADERGFAAIGYLLYGIDLTDEEILTSFKESENRRNYLSDLIAQINTYTTNVLNKWRADGENYVSEFKENTGTNVGASLSLLTNAMTQSLERKTRDGKIGIPSGLRTLGVAVPNAVEALYAEYSVELATANLNAYYNLFLGRKFGSATDADMSYLEYLTLLGNSQLSGDINEAFTQTIISVGVLDEPFDEEVQNNPDPSIAATAELQQLIVLIKSEMSSAMGISITFQDNDGD